MPSASDGIGLYTDGCTVEGLVINGFDQGAGVSMVSSNSTIRANYIGTDVTGTVDMGNRDGIVVNGNFNLIGTEGQDTYRPRRQKPDRLQPPERRLPQQRPAQNVVAGNWIEYNQKYGIYIFVSSFNLIGANSNFGFETPSQRNVISGNGDVGIYIGNPISTGNVVAGNYVGTTPDGVGHLGNRGGGIRLDQGATGNIIGGLNETERNVLAANLFHGISLDRSASNNLIEGNYIGVDAAGNPLGNGANGVLMKHTATGNTVGGTTADAANVIAFNQANGIDIGVDTSDQSDGNSILGNSIYGNSGLGIDLGSDGVTPNHTGGAISGAPNGLQNYPVVNSAVGFPGQAGIRWLDDRRRYAQRGSENDLSHPVLCHSHRRPFGPRPGPDDDRVDQRDDPRLRERQFLPDFFHRRPSRPGAVGDHHGSGRQYLGIRGRSHDRRWRRHQDHRGLRDQPLSLRRTGHVQRHRCKNLLGRRHPDGDGGVLRRHHRSHAGVLSSSGVATLSTSRYGGSGRTRSRPPIPATLITRPAPPRSCIRWSIRRRPPAT